MNLRLVRLPVAAFVLVFLFGSRNEASSGEPQTGGKLILSAPLTHSDWVLKDNVPGLDDGLAGVRHMLDMCQAAGWSRIYWRCLDAGRSLYPSKLMDPMGPPHGDNYFDPKPEEVGKVGAQKNEVVLRKMKDRFHYGTIDSLAEAVRYGHQIGLEIHAWFSINEDDHAWGWPSRYTVAHPEHRWKRRDGSYYRSQLSFAHPQVRSYKLAIIQEVLDNYPVDGIFIDWIRTGDVRDPQVDASGVADYGYEDILAEGFRAKFGLDPRRIPNNDLRWVRHRAEPQTEFMRSVRRLADSRTPKLPVAVMVQHPWSYRGDNPKYADNLQGLLLDVETWAREGLMDAAVPAGYYAPNSGGTPELAYEHLKKLTGGKTDIWMYAWVPSSAVEFLAGLERARKLGCHQILYWEADYIDNNPKKAELQKVMRENAAMPTVQDVTLGDGSGWHFVGGHGPWTEAEGVIRPPDERNLHSRAFAVRQAYRDFTAEYEFRGDYRETGTGAAAFIFRASDVNHGYMVYCPWGGQQLRAKHFWVQLMRLDGDGYLRSLKSVWVPGVPSETDRWYKIRLQASGSTIRVLVDGRRAIEVVDDTYASGAVGFAGYGWYSFRNARVSGAPGTLAQWDRTQKIPVHHFTVGLDDSTMPSGCVAPNGDVLLAAGNLLVRSKDKGRTWESPVKLPDKLGTVTDYGNTLFAAQGRLVVQTWRERTDAKKDVPEIGILESTDNGATWSDPVSSEVAAGWPEVPAKLTPYGPMIQTVDGTWVRFLLGSAAEGSRFSNVVTWGATHCKAYAIRSTDQGKHWSGPIEVDQPSWSGQPRGTVVGSLDLTEVTGVPLGNRIMAVVRPVYSPYMWQLWSADSGANWDAAARTTFPGYAQSMARTQAGVIAVAHRFPQYSVNLSRDDGLNWDEGTVIDYPAWAMGCLLEVEPNVLLATYMNWEHKSQPLLAQLIRIAPQRIEPVAAGR